MQDCSPALFTSHLQTPGRVEQLANGGDYPGKYAPSSWSAYIKFMLALAHGARATAGA
jgi:hypothetical protein